MSSRAVSFVTLQENTIKYMLQFVEEYELVKAKQHKDYKYARQFFADKNICFQNFYKFYNRYVTSGRDASKLLPYRRGPKPKYVTMPQLEMSDIESKVLEYRQEGHNRYIIAEALKGDSTLKGPCSASTVYSPC